MASAKTFAFEEVSKHNNKKDCWIMIHGKVYDVTSFLDDHPGGDESLISATGKDASVDFEDVGHSDSAIDMMHKYFIGMVDTSNKSPTEVDSNPPPRPPTQARSNSDQSSGFVSKALQFLLPLLILAFAFAMQYYGKKKQVSDA
ncbi:unnamed protein product [Vicia faba]|uniref:Cytochrome b5 heme-binding domain-containing protein n=1 Tax=Vicia faba TaxID=3906 RepID=A0AAV1AZM8_VICFA|nr:unnamed protein product [Vicia faba]